MRRPGWVLIGMLLVASAGAARAAARTEPQATPAQPPSATPAPQASSPPTGPNATGVRQEIFRRMSRGRDALEAGDYQLAAVDLCWAARRALNSHDAAWLCGRARLLTRDPEGAVKALTLATEIDPRHLGSWIDLGDALLAAGRPAEARPAFYKALEIRKDYSPAWDGLARLAERTGKGDEALELFGKALEANAADARARLHRGQLHQRAGRLDQAIADISEAARLRPEDGEVQLGLAEIELQAGRAEQALAAARQAARAMPRDPRVPALTAQIFLRLGGLTEAEEAARRALEIDPDLAPARLVLGTVLGRRGRLEEAVAVLVPPDPAVLDAREVAQLEQERRLWDGRRAERDRLETAAQRPDAAPADLLALAELRLATGNVQGASEVAERLAPHAADTATRRRVGLVLGEAGRLRAAAALFEAVAASGEATSTDLVNLGVLRERTGDTAGAEQAYGQALAKRADEAEAHAGLARLALAKGDRAAAAGALRRYLASNPPAPYVAPAREALARLEEARKP